MSGTTPWASNAQVWLPIRPRPVWTSSAMHSPPAARPPRETPAGEPAGGEDDLAADAGAGLGEERRRCAVAAGQLVDGAREVGGVLRAGVGVAALVGAAVVVGECGDVDPVGRAAAAGAGVLVGARVDQGRGVAVVGGVEYEEVAPAGGGAREPQRELRGLAGRGGGERGRGGGAGRGRCGRAAARARWPRWQS